MSGYEYAYSVSPARPSGWRSILAGCVTVVTVVAVSGISGAVVTLELIAPKSSGADAVPAVAARLSETTGASQHTASIAAPSAPVNPVARERKADQVPRAALTPVAAPAPAQSRPAVAQSRPAVAAAPQAIAPAPGRESARALPDSELTFAKGYAQRHAAQEAADSKVAAVSQLGRAAVPHKPAYARSNVSPDPRRLARGDATGYYDRPDGFDFRRHEALAYGEEQRPRRPRGFFNMF